MAGRGTSPATFLLVESPTLPSKGIPAGQLWPEPSSVVQLEQSKGARSELVSGPKKYCIQTLGELLLLFILSVILG